MTNPYAANVAVPKRFGVRSVRRVGGFARALLLIAVIAFAIRVGYAWTRSDTQPVGDSLVFHEAANALADGEGFTKSVYIRDGGLVVDPANPEPSANPPMGVVYYAAGSMLGLRGFSQHMVWASLAGTATVALVGLLGRRLVDAATGLVSALMAALYPSLWSWDGFVTSETLAAMLAVAVVLASLRYGEAPSRLRAAIVGLLGGIALLTRSELALYLPLLFVPLVIADRQRSWRARLATVGATAAIALCVLTPWWIYNAGRFEHPVLLTTGFGQTLASANCDVAYQGEYIGYWSLGCNLDVAASEAMPSAPDQTEADRVYASAATRYQGQHRTQLLTRVIPARVGRVFYLFRPLQQLSLDRDIEGREPFVAASAFWSYWALVVLSGFGLRVLRRSGARLWPLIMPFVVVTAGVVMTFGNVRYRATAEPFLCVAAGIGLTAIARRAVRTRLRLSDAGDSTNP